MVERINYGVGFGAGAVPDVPDLGRKRHPRPHASAVEPDTPIWCPACATEHPASAFNKEARRYSGLSGICREAQAQARKTPEGKAKTRRSNQRRWANPEYRLRGLAANRARRQVKGSEDLRKARARLQRVVDQWKQQGCIECGYDDIRAIDPDHRDTEVKVDNISRMVTLCASEERIRAELAKCDPRCARCHRRRTQASRPNSWRSLESLPPSWRERLELQDFNDRMRLARGCQDCGWREWVRGLDWDHVRGRKMGGISEMIAARMPLTLIMIEMDKCDVVCANCHRLRTCLRRQSMRAERTD